MTRFSLWVGLFLLCLATPLTAQNTTAAAPQVRVVHFNLGGAVGETPVDDPFNLSGGQVTALKTLIEKLDNARKDSAVKAVLLTWNGMQVGLAQAEEINAALGRLKTDGKPVMVHLAGEALAVSLVTYAMLSNASTISLEPRSDLWLTGLHGEQLFLKDMLGKIGVEADYLHMGDYKSAGEMFTNTAPSTEADAMMNWLFDGMYENLVAMIAKGRGLQPERVRELIDKGPYLAEDAVEAGLADKVQFKDEFVAGLKDRFGEGVMVDNSYEKKEKPKVDLGNPFAFMQIFSELSKPAARVQKNVIAVVYVDGMILSGHAQPSPFGSSGIAYGGDVNYWLEQAAQDKNVKAVVLRIDSPGGSALGSEQIWRATQEVRKVKPIVASMGNTAASGGYYSACGAQSIFADRNTITASIGVVGGKFVTTQMWQKLGVNWVPYQRGANAGMFGSATPFSPEQRAQFEGWMQSVYERFQDRVKEGRGEKLKEPLENLTGGRVFTGLQAKERGLIDEIGGLTSATAHAAKLAGIEHYEVVVMPQPKDFITQLMEEFSGTRERTSDLHVPGNASVNAAAVSPAFFPALGASDSLIPEALIAADPLRAQAFLRALNSLALLKREGVALMMPFELIVQ